MPRKQLICTNEFPYHITNRSNNKEFFYLDKNELWSIFMEVFFVAKKRHFCDFHCFVLMSNHYHLILDTPKSNLSEVMTHVHREVARKANKASKRVNHFFGGRYKWCLIQSEQYYWNAIKYILRNPVEAGMCELVEEYPYSSINDSSSQHFWRNAILNQSETSQGYEIDRDWLNQSFKNSQKDAVKMALRRRIFRPPLGESGKRVTIETPQYKKGLGTF